MSLQSSQQSQDASQQHPGMKRDTTTGPFGSLVRTRLVGCA
ncbi:hypothetical protein [Methylobacterium sp. GXS13]|nr:hypothetical protein [Methylobacterium sp. GXS13]